MWRWQVKAGHDLDLTKAELDDCHVQALPRNLSGQQAHGRLIREWLCTVVCLSSLNRFRLILALKSGTGVRELTSILKKNESSGVICTAFPYNPRL